MMEASRKTILVIEDNEDIREGTKEILKLAGYTVYTADNGKKGVELVQQQLPDIIICDIMMPELDGYGVLYLLHKDEETADIPFIFMTAKAERADLRKGMEMGADDYLTKPFTDIELLNAIETRLQKTDHLKKRSGSADHPVNEGLSEKLLKDLSENSRVRSYKKKQNIYMDGDSPSNVYLIKSGTVRTFMVSPDAREIATGIYVPGDFFGYKPVLLNKPYTDNAETLEVSELHLISKDEFSSLLTKDPGISKKFIKLLSGNVQEKQDQLLKLAYNSVRKRVADALVSLAEKFGDVTIDNTIVKVSRDDLAAMVGTANETISRTLSDFKDERLIEKEGSSIRIFSIDKLKKIKQ